ncbi:hypothetical protein [Acidihalobacter ferrooxydans]|uniref:Uncharacterized protein n=1 Tax=Acidihalobacter ferrooxydans TaxID=1765967 RepID=A0A1P8UJ37_9GAMM|nr:hypothetical protein [Acidihalobacter ferrooxydans]APZ43848.1 hypothetical protein BW247_12730 [Acidihalobacter ferrooxydans]
MAKKIVTLQTHMRRKEAVKLRLAGLSYRQIGDRLGISHVAALNHVRAVLDELRSETAETAEQIRRIELERLDCATALAMRMIDRGELAGIDRLIKIQERRARLLGLDAAERVDVSTQEIPTVIIAEPVSPRLPDTKH